MWLTGWSTRIWKVYCAIAIQLLTQVLPLSVNWTRCIPYRETLTRTSTGNRVNVVRLVLFSAHFLFTTLNLKISPSEYQWSTCIHCIFEPTAIPPVCLIVLIKSFVSLPMYVHSIVRHSCFSINRTCFEPN